VRPTRGVCLETSTGHVTWSSVLARSRARGTRRRCHGSVRGAAHAVGSICL